EDLDRLGYLVRMSGNYAELSITSESGSCEVLVGNHQRGLVDNHVFRVHELELRWRPLDFGPDRDKFIENVLLRAEHAKGVRFEDYSHANAALFRVLEASNDVIAREEVHDQVDGAASVIDFVE